MKTFISATGVLLLVTSLGFAVDPGVLTGTYPGDTYGGLIHFDGNTGAPAAVPAQVYDGLGNLLPMQASQTTISFTGIFTMTQVNAASGSANPFDYTGTLGIFNGTDDFTLFDINITNANHTGGTNTVQVLDIATITQDAEATETAINIAAGWDSGLTSLSTVKLDGGFSVDTPAFVVADTTGALTTTGAIAANGGISVDTPAFSVADTTGAITSSGLATLTGGLTLGADDDISDLILHDASTIQIYDDSDDTSITFGPVVNGTTYMGMTGGFDGLDLGSAAAKSVLTFAGADAAGNWKLIDTTGAGGVAGASDYYIYNGSQVYWDATGDLRSSVVTANTHFVGPRIYFTGNVSEPVNANGANIGQNAIMTEGATADDDELTINFPTFNDGGAGNQGGESDPTATMMVGRCTSETIVDTGADVNPATDTLDPVANHNCYLYTCNDDDTCDVTMAEATAFAGQILTITNTTANALDLADQAGILNINGAAVALVTDDTITLMYTGTSWLEIARSDN